MLIIILIVIAFLGWSSMCEQSAKPYGCGCGGFITMILAIVFIVFIILDFGGLFF